MLNTQKQYLDYLNSIDNQLTNTHLSSDIINNFSTKGLSNSIKNIELLIPIIGAFSAGKSTLLNSFLGRDLLSVGITPETALATELRYSAEERIEAVKPDGYIDKYSLDQMNKIIEKSAEYKLLKIYLADEKLKAIEPLILVDMPGFDSPLDSHNQAILEYIDKGTHYIVLTSVEDGTITHSMQRQLFDIKEYKRDFSFFVSKANYRADNEVKEVVSLIEEQIEDIFDCEKMVVAIDNNGGESLKKIIQSIDPETLFKRLFEETLKNHYFKISEMLNTTISAYKSDKDKNLHAIEELKIALGNIEKEKNRLIKTAKEKYATTRVNRIVDNIGMELSNSLEELVGAYSSGGDSALSRSVAEITRHALVHNVQISMQDISNDIIGDFTLNLKNISDSQSGFQLDEAWIEKIGDTTKTLLNSTGEGLKKYETNKQGGNTSYGSLATIISTIAATINPILGAIVGVLSMLFSGGGNKKENQQEQQRDQVRDSIIGQIIPSVKSKIRGELPIIFEKQTTQLINSIGDEFEHSLQSKKEEINAAEIEREKDSQQISVKITELEKTQQQVSTAANTLLFN